MSSASADRLISRITALHKSLRFGEGSQPSAMERDLMLGYLRELYEIYAHGEAENETSDKRQATRPVGTASVVTPTVSPAPVAAPTPPPAPAPAPVVNTPRPAPKPEPAPVVMPPSPPPAPAPAPVVPSPAPAAAPTSSASKAVKALFVEDAAASPFGRQPVADLTRALSINSRALFTRDLFGGDNDLLNTTLRTLNSSGSITAAQPVLESLARRFDWTVESKTETAKEFIELVRRRYA